MCVKACSAAALSGKKRGIRAALMNVKIPTPHASLLGEAAGLGMSRVLSFMFIWISGMSPKVRQSLVFVQILPCRFPPPKIYPTVAEIR